MRYCPTCGTRLKTTTSRGGLPRRVCPECHGGERQ
ncbi:zf-TFIIB domain-containing protein [Haloferax mucosum]